MSTAAFVVYVSTTVSGAVVVAVAVVSATRRQRQCRQRGGSGSVGSSVGGAAIGTGGFGHLIIIV
jgi:hypothetical protein